MQNSWYIKQNEEHHFFCKCGTHDIIENHLKDGYVFDMVKFKIEDIDFNKIPNLYYPDNACSVCGNEHYLDMNALLFDNTTLYWSDIKWDYEQEEDNLSWSIASFLHIPIFNEEDKTITLKKLKLSTCIVEKKGRYYYKEHSEFLFKKSFRKKGKYQRINKFCKDNMHNNIIQFIVKNPLDSLKWLNGEIEHIDELLFFLEYNTIKFKEILLWKQKEYFNEALNTCTDVVSFLDYFLNHRKEKSLRKIQFNSYKKMMQSGGYNPMADYIFSRTISDRNHLLKAIGMNISIKEVLFNNCNIENIYHFIDFLKNHYTEKHIVRFWLSIEHNDLSHYLLRDSSDLFSTEEMRIELNEKFKKTALNIRTIHHELTRHSRKLRITKKDKKLFTYSDNTLDMQVELEGLSYRLPPNNDTLYEWGALLHNCLFSYSNSVFEGVTIIFGIFIDNDLIYAIEIRNNIIVQASSNYNRTLTTIEREKIDRWHKKVYLPMVMKVLNKTS